MPATDRRTVCAVSNVEPEPVLTVTVAVPPSSPKDDLSTDSPSDGAGSLSESPMERPPDGVTLSPLTDVDPRTVRLSSGSSIRSFAGVSVKRAVMPVIYAGIVSVRSSTAA